MQTYGNDFNPRYDTTNVSEIRSLDELIRTYPDQNLIPQFKKLQQTYPYYRAVSGDGNCFYRALAFMYFREARLNSFNSVFQDIQNCCINYPLDFEGISFEAKIRELYQTCLAPLNNVSPIERQDILAKHFCGSMVFDTIMIMYFRSLNYQYIKRNLKKFSNYIDSPQRVEQIRIYRNQSEGIEYQAMANALNIQISVKITDRHGLQTQQYNKKPSYTSYDLFFRPGHFDILYHKDSLYLKKKSSPYREFFTETPQYNSHDRRSTQSYFQPKINKYSSINSLNSVKDNFPLEMPKKSMKVETIENKPNGKSNPFMSLSTLRSNKPSQPLKIQTIQQEDINKRQKQKQAKPHKNSGKISVPIQKYKSWEVQSKDQVQPWKKVKELFVISLFFVGLGYTIYAF